MLWVCLEPKHHLSAYVQEFWPPSVTAKEEDAVHGAESTGYLPACVAAYHAVEVVARVRDV